MKVLARGKLTKLKGKLKVSTGPADQSSLKGTKLHSSNSVFSSGGPGSG